jgi:hypothetical protein
MALYVFLFVGCLLLSLALLWRLDWLRFRLSSSPGIHPLFWRPEI